MRLAQYQVARRSGLGLVDPLVKAAVAVMVVVLGRGESPWLSLLAVYFLLRVVAFIVNRVHFQRRLSLLTHRP